MIEAGIEADDNENGDSEPEFIEEKGIIIEVIVRVYKLILKFV